MSAVPPFNIIVADDEESIRSIVAEILEDEGYSVEAFANGKDALARVQQGGVHVVISDIRMPQMTGIELLEQVKTLDPNIEVIIMTSHASIETAIKAMRLGAYDYLTKPFEDLNLITTVVDRTIGKLELEIEVRKLLEKLKKRNEEIQQLYQHTTELFSTLNLKEILLKSCQALHEISHQQDVYCVTYDPTDKTAKLSAFFPDSAYEAPSQKDKETGLSIAMTQDSMDQLGSDPRLDAAVLEKLPVENAVLFPFNIDNHCQGFYVINNLKGSLNQSLISLLQQYVNNAAAQIDKAQLHATIESMAIHDDLTGLFNRRHFNTTLAKEITRAKRFNKPISVFLFDIDHFKNYNDQNGHPQGDRLLQEMSKLLLGTSRQTDVAARYGGEEFVVILTETDKAGAEIKAKRLCSLVAEHAFPNGDTQPLGKVTISGGYAEYPTDATSAEELIELADQALYTAKNAGRNQVLAAKPSNKSIA